MNPSEYKIFKVVEHDVLRAHQGFRVFTQTSVDEILESQREDAFCPISNKRADILVVDRGGWPCSLLNIRAPAHHQGNAAARDAIKKEALRKAGVGYIEIAESDTPA